MHKQLLDEGNIIDFICRSLKVPWVKSSTATGWCTQLSRTRFLYRVTPIDTWPGVTRIRVSGWATTSLTKLSSSANPTISLDR